MLPRTTFSALAAVAAALALTPAPASALTEGSNLLQSRPGGLAAFPGGGVNTSSMTRFALSATGCRTAFTSESDALINGDDDRVPNVYVMDECGTTDVLWWVSRSSSFGASDDLSGAAAISPNGRWVAFNSRGALDGARASDAVYVHDMTDHKTYGMSRAADGTLKDGIQHAVPSVSNDGDVAFTTRVALTADDKNTVADVYVRRRTSGTTELVSRGAATDAASDNPSISADGTTIAFASGAQLDAADTNTLTDVYARTAGGLTLVSRGSGGAVGGQQPAADADGSAIAFATTAALDAKDTNAKNDVYRWTSAATTLVSRPDGLDSTASDAFASAPSISATGDVVTFVSDAKDYTTPAQTTSSQDVFRRDLSAGTTRLMSRRGLDGAYLTDGANTAAMSADGTSVAFATVDNAILDDDADDFQQVVGRDVASGDVRLISRAPGTGRFDGNGINKSSSLEGAISADGRYVAFVSESDALLTTDDDRFRNAYVRDNLTGTTEQVNLTADDEPGTSNVTDVVISDDGRRVAFTTGQRMAPQDLDGGLTDVFLRDLAAGTTVLMSRGAGADATAGANVEAGEPAISGDGTRVAFTTRESLTAGDTNAGRRDLYVRDVAGEHRLALASPGNTADDTMSPALDRDGSAVAFVTPSPLDPTSDPDTGAGDRDVYLRDLTADKTELISRATGAAGAAGNQTSQNPALSADGERVVFDTYASNLSSGPVGYRTVQLRDRAEDSTTLVSRPPGMGPTAPNGQSQRPSISADGKRIAYQSTATNIGNGETLTGQELIWVRDTNLGNMGNTLVTRFAANGVPANGPSSTPAISANGRCVAFSSNAPNLDSSQHVAGDHAQIWLRAVSGACPDQVAPVTVIDGGPSGPTQDTSPQVAFHATEDGTTFECKVGAGAWGACTSPYKFAGLADGDYTLAIRATDMAGNAEGEPKTRSFTVDTRAPVVAWTTPLDSVTGDATPTVGFEADEAGITYQCRIDGEDIEPCASPLTLPALTEGDHELTVQASDAAGNSGNILIAPFAVDLTGAVAAITDGPVGTTADTTPRFAFTSEDGATFRCAVDAAPLATCTSPWTSGALAEGKHTFRVQAVDAHGTAGPVVERAFVVDLPDARPQDTPKAQGGAAAPQPTGSVPSTSAPRGSSASGGSRPGTVRLVGKTAKAKRGRLSLTLRCTGGACRGTVVLKAKAGRKLVVVARGSYAVAAGRTAKVTVRLTAAGRRALKQGKRLKATAEIGGRKTPLTLRG